MRSSLITIALSAAALAAPSNFFSPQCVDSIAQISASGTNFDLSTGAPPANATVPVNGTYSIQLHFCKPTTPIPSRSKTLQVLVHGIGLNGGYWYSGFQPEKYSYVRYMAALGFPTLTVTRLGYGNSSHPDPVGVVQAPYDVAIVSAILKAAREGNFLGATCAFNRIVYVGHSYGSIIGNGVIASQPKLIDAAVFTGYSHGEIDASKISLIPAATVDPIRFAGLPDGYLTTPNITARAATFFSSTPNSYDPKALAFDFAHEDIAAFGEVLTSAYAVVPAPKFTGPVLAINGADDILFCKDTTCSNLEAEKTFYPKAKSFDAVVIPSTGHSLNFHYSAPKTFCSISSWLVRRGF
ncbi:alpha/beta-hydrolase [Exidia glandulosa HHB12029]|uniref:Alpha/beta-hydrolase n=1 Tax=Exidia glandulosa HHB12029 TaxID=1314781 RepID=A0A165AVJ5_EXIGL|nr:alpha/beta-hydrolase [Exidia glandulosa HHB12029]